MMTRATSTPSSRISVSHVNLEPRRWHHIHVSHVDASCIDVSHIDESHIDSSHVNESRIDGSHVNDSHIDGSHIDASHIDAQRHQREPCR